MKTKFLHPRLDGPTAIARPAEPLQRITGVYKVPIPLESPSPASLAVDLHRDGQSLEEKRKHPDGDERLLWVLGLKPQTYAKLGQRPFLKQNQIGAHLLQVNVKTMARVLLMTATPTMPSKTADGYASIKYAKLKSPAQPQPNPIKPSPM